MYNFSSGRISRAAISTAQCIHPYCTSRFKFAVIQDTFIADIVSVHESATSCSLKYEVYKVPKKYN